jgi:hypothetical protein
VTSDRAIAAVVAEAKRYLGVVEVPRGSNRGTQIDYWVAEASLDPKGAYAWCAAYVGQVGRQALGVLWPCPRTAGVMALVTWAKKDAARWATVPVAGDLFVIWNAKVDGGRYAHVGFVTAVRDDAFDTLEGNTNGGGSRDGYGVFARTRTRDATTRFLRWTAAL